MEHILYGLSEEGYGKAFVRLSSQGLYSTLQLDSIVQPKNSRLKIVLLQDFEGIFYCLLVPWTEQSV